MTKKLTDLEGRLDAALTRADKADATRIDVIGRYRMHDAKGAAPADIIFTKVTQPDGSFEYVVWNRNLSKMAKYRGYYCTDFREALGVFLSRIDADNGGKCSTDCDHYECPQAGVQL